MAEFSTACDFLNNHNVEEIIRIALVLNEAIYRMANHQMLSGMHIRQLEELYDNGRFDITDEAISSMDTILNGFVARHAVLMQPDDFRQDWVKRALQLQIDGFIDNISPTHKLRDAINNDLLFAYYDIMSDEQASEFKIMLIQIMNSFHKLYDGKADYPEIANVIIKNISLLGSDFLASIKNEMFYDCIETRILKYMANNPELCFEETNEAGKAKRARIRR